MKIKGQQRQTLSAKESFYVGESVLNAFEAGKENAHSMDVLTSSEHKEGGDGSFYGYATIKHPRLGEFIVSFNTETGRARTNGFPWEFLSEEKYKLTNDQAAWVMAHQADLAEELNKDNPSFKFEEYKKPKPVSFNPYQPNISAGQELVFKEDIYYGDHETIADFVDIEIDPEEKLTREEARWIEDEATKLGFEFDEQENMFYFPEGTHATLVSQKGLGGWPVFKIGDVEYNFAGDPFLVQFANEEEESAGESACSDKKDAKPAKETFNRRAHKFSKEAYEALIASMEAEGDEFTLPDEYIMNPPEVNFKKILQERDRKREEEAKVKADQDRRDAVAAKYRGLIDKINAAPEVTLDSSDDRLNVAFDALVPPDGKADTVAGEIVRALMRILYRWYNDGDYFYKGYGLETAASSMEYLVEEVEMLDDSAVGQFVEEDPSEKAYERRIVQWANEVMDELIAKPELFGEPNDVDSRDYSTDWIESIQPTYDFELYASDDLKAHMDKGNCDVWALKSYVEDMLQNDSTTKGAEVERPWGHSDQYLTVTGLTEDGRETLQDWFRNTDSFWEDLVNELTEENGDPYDEDDGDEDEDYDEEGADESVNDASKPANERIDKEDAIPDEDWVSRLNVIDVGNVESWPAEKIQAIFGDDAFWSDSEEDVLLGDEGWDGKVRRNGRVVGELNTETGKVELIK